MTTSETPLPAQTASRFFSYRWAYVFLSAILWMTLLSLFFFPGDTQHYWTPSFLIAMGWPGNVEACVELQLHSVFGFSLSGFDYSYYYGSSSSPSFWFENASIISGTVVALLLAILVASYVVPERGRATNLPATRSIPLRGQAAAALVFGLAATALVAAAIEIVEYDIDAFFMRMEWLPTHSTPASTGAYWYGPPPAAYWPDSGIAAPISWISTVALTLFFGAACWLCLAFVRIGRDRFWQAERWTLIYTALGLGLIAIASFGMNETRVTYDELYQFLGGCYTAWIVGWFTLTWAWTSRTCMFLMITRYEKATIDPSNPVCMACGYSLRGLDPTRSSKCPECGANINPALLVTQLPKES